MSHEIDTSNSRYNMAFTNRPPWHGLGTRLTAGASFAQWEREAGLSYTVRESFVRFATSRDPATSLQLYKDRKVLFRDDTLAPLSVVSSGYRTVQPREVLGFFQELVDVAGFTLETAGSLAGGRRIWALAKVSDGANVVGGRDRVLPYVLFATSYDGTMATIAKFTAIRVVCSNTLRLASSYSEGEVRVPHSTRLDREKVRRELGLVVSTFDRWLADARRFASQPISLTDAEVLTARLMTPHTSRKNVEESSGYKKILNLFRTHTSIGASLTQGPTLWNWLSSVTETIDHNTGRSPDTRLSSAWFGAGERLKSGAQDLALDFIQQS